MRPSKANLAHIINIGSQMGDIAVDILKDLDLKLPSWMYRGTRRGNRSGKKYIPGGKHANVEPSIIRNNAVALNVALDHEKWRREQFPSRVTKKEADPNSITSIKQGLGCHRSVARRLKTEMDARKEAQQNTVDTSNPT